MEMRPNSMDVKQEGHDHQTSYMSSLRQNPRIVRVSRAFGGKDRHSKVCTVRGLRDRRIRLSAMTAIHLYDLQERLGLSQPSKVIDWLLKAAQNDVDLLPPLRFPPGFFHPNLTAGARESYPGVFDPEPASINQICIGHTKMLGRHCFDPGSCSLKTDTIQRESLDLEQRRWDKTDESSNLVHGFDIDHHFFSNSSQSNRLCFPSSSTYNSSSSYHYNLGHLQQSLVDQSGNVTVALSNNNLNPSAAEAMSSTFPRYPSFLEGGQLQLFSSNSNMSKQAYHVE